MFDYREFLLGELARRRARNPHYSLRAFARDLELSPSRLSEALNGVRGISLAAARQVCRVLELSSEERSLVLLSVSALHARAAHERARAQKALLKKERQLAEQPTKPALPTRTGWIEAAVLQMHRNGRDLSDSQGVASSLAVPEFMVVSALRFLTRHGYVSGLPGYKDYLKEKGAEHALHTDYQQVLDKARTYVETRVNDTVLARNAALACEALSFRSEDLPAARRIIQDALAQLKELAAAHQEGRVHFAAMQLFPVEETK